jgi:kumamolisin
MNRLKLVFMMATTSLLLGAGFPSGLAQTVNGTKINGFTAVVPQSSIPQEGRIHTNYFIARSDVSNPGGPPPGTETPASLACVYKLVKGRPKGCPVATTTTNPSGGVGAIAIVDAGDYPSAASDLHAFSSYFGIPDADFEVVYANGKKPPVYGDWEVEEALDIEWAHAMAPQAKLFLVESVEVRTDPTWKAVQVAADLVAQNGGGVVSMSWGIREFANEKHDEKFFKTPGVVYFAASGDSGLFISSHPAASPNVVAVGGTVFNRDRSGNFVSETYSGGGGGDISPYEPIPTYQKVIQNIVGSHRGYPDVASDYCCAPIYLQGWGAVGGTSWSSPTFAGIVNAAGKQMMSTKDELTMIYHEYTKHGQYQAYFNDITSGDSNCKTGWDLCAGVGSPRTYNGK